ncbi:MAG: TonB-dependent receptor [Betaproteobacteria bacterium]|nr:TonB-dependent receptor [Betaproteobacteria bacterium]
MTSVSIAASARGRAHAVAIRAQSLFLSLLTAALLAVLTNPAVAQSSDASTARVVITGNPLGSALAQPSELLTGDALAVRRAGTLGETLSGLAGVSASGFGPQSSRPVIRGLDGDRIRLLDNGGASADASNLSFDHAVAVDPLVVERIEVLRGPAALLYGGNATGGVVNTIDNRIPRDPLSGLGGRAELRLGGAAAERASSALVEGGQDGLNWHVDAAQRRSADLRTPRFTPRSAGPAGPQASRIANSAGDSRSAALGSSWADARGYVGIALDNYRNDYGVTVEPDVTIKMQRQRTQLAGERRGLAGPFNEFSFQASQTRYQHQEVEGSGAVGTTFSSQGSELRLQAKQAAQPGLGGVWRGVVGLQLEQLDFSALGAEAFVPTSHTRSTGLFTLQELAIGPLNGSAGARVEQARIRSDGDASALATPRFGAATQRDFQPLSLSLGLVAKLGAGWQASATLGSTERAPAYYELYANGLHVATGAYERGDPGQQLERSRHLELGLQWQQGASKLHTALFATRFANYIALAATGLQIGVKAGAPTNRPEYRFIGVPAALHGFEAEARHRLLAGPWQLETSAGLDLVRGSNSATGEPLPRIAPMRLQLGLDAAQGVWRAGVALKSVARQDRVPAEDIATGGATLVDLWARWQQRWGDTDAVWSLKLANLGNALAYNATALRSARALSPAGGRALTAGLRLSF